MLLKVIFCWITVPVKHSSVDVAVKLSLFCTRQNRCSKAPCSQFVWLCVHICWLESGFHGQLLLAFRMLTRWWLLESKVLPTGEIMPFMTISACLTWRRHRIGPIGIRRLLEEPRLELGMLPFRSFWLCYSLLNDGFAKSVCKFQEREYFWTKIKRECLVLVGGEEKQL